MHTDNYFWRIAIACGSSLSCYSVVDGITMMAADAAAAMASLTMETAVAVMPDLDPVT